MWILKEASKCYTWRFWNLTFKRFCTECGLVKYEPIDKSNPHRDTLYGAKHYRLIVILKGDPHFNCDRATYVLGCKRIIWYRADLCEHCFEKSESSRLVLSLGIAKF